MYIILLFYINVGLMGGGSYVNTAYLILNDNILLKEERELSFNFSVIFNDTGTLLAAVFSLIITK